MRRIALLAAASCALAACGSDADDADSTAGASPPESEAAAPAGDAPVEVAVAGPTCTPAETTIFTCTLESGKTVSVCSNGGERATYRFGGDVSEIELTGGQWARVGYSGGGELQIAFDNTVAGSTTRYVVFGRTIPTNFSPEDHNPPGGGEGVLVLRGGTFQAIQKCREDSDASYYGEASEAAMQKLPQSDELFTDESYRVDEM